MIAAAKKREMAADVGGCSAKLVCPGSAARATMSGHAVRSLADFLEEALHAGRIGARRRGSRTPRWKSPKSRAAWLSPWARALLFDRPAAKRCAVVTNLLGTESRACRALGVESLDELSERIESLIDKNTPHNWFERLKMTGDETGTNKFRPKSVKSGPCSKSCGWDATSIWPGCP